jgi:hypothetical protein
MNQGYKLRELLNKPGIIILPGVFDCISAKFTEQLGFEVVFTSGFGISASTLSVLIENPRPAPRTFGMRLYCHGSKSL